MHRAGPLRRTPLAVAAALWVLAASWYLGTEALAARAFPGYSYAANYISDLGVPEVGVVDGRAVDSPLAQAMNAAFVLHGVLFAGAAALAARAVGGGAGRFVVVALAGVHAVGIVLVGVFHGGAQAVEDGTAALHGLGAVLAIVAGDAALVTAGLVLRRRGLAPGVGAAGVALGALGLVCAGVLTAAMSAGVPVLVPDGVWERGAVYPIQAWELTAAVAVLAGLLRPRRAAARGQAGSSRRSRHTDVAEPT